MKKKSLPKALILSKETLLELTSKEPPLVQGGNEIDSAWPSCPSVCRTC
jgi:hypothetical protein